MKDVAQTAYKPCIQRSTASTSHAGVTLRENNLKELEGGHILWSQGALVANRRALKERPGLLEVVHELIERFEAHLEAGKFYSVLANVRGDSAKEVITSCSATSGQNLPRREAFSWRRVWKTPMLLSCAAECSVLMWCR